MTNCLLVLGLLVMVCCSTRRDSQFPDKKVEAPAREDGESILYGREVLHNFSSSLEKDTFKIYATGPSIIDGQIKFQIISNEGLVILDEVFPPTSFLDYGLKENPTDSDKEEYLKGRIEKFFNEDNFHQPAISAESAFDEDYTKREIWDDIISDQTAIGFYYLIGDEDGRHIAFSKKLKRVVVYYNCC
jgi:hypothetical protein